MLTRLNGQYELAGMGWHQGWNDRYGSLHITMGGLAKGRVIFEGVVDHYSVLRLRMDGCGIGCSFCVEEYGANLKNFVKVGI